jgi:DNA-binding GntR family transcriptional regulator
LLAGEKGVVILKNTDPLKLEIDDTVYLGERAYLMLREAIIDGEFSPGEWVSERQLSERMGVSTSPIKNALKRLEYDGLVVNVPRRGRKVADFIMALEEVSLIRAALEGVGARLAAEKATESDIEELRKWLDVMEEGTACSQDGELVNANTEFHNKIREIARNNYILQVVDTLRVYDEKIRAEALSDKEEAYRGLGEHKRIFEAISQRCGQKAKQETEKHVLRSAQFVLDRLRKEK